MCICMYACAFICASVLTTSKYLVGKFVAEFLYGNEIKSNIL